jgi:hypothetical protein
MTTKMGVSCSRARIALAAAIKSKSGYSRAVTMSTHSGPANPMRALSPHGHFSGAKHGEKVASNTDIKR